MRTLSTTELLQVSGSKIVPETHPLAPAAEIGIVLALAGVVAEGIFGGVCGHHLAGRTGHNRLAGTTIGLTAGLLFFPAIGVIPKWVAKATKYVNSALFE